MKFFIYMVILMLVILFFLNINFFRPNCSGDICSGTDKLVYVFAKNKILCRLVNGEYKEKTSGWSNNKIKECKVTAKWLCNLRGGEIFDYEKIDNKEFYLVVPDKYYCTKK